MINKSNILSNILSDESIKSCSTVNTIKSLMYMAKTAKMTVT